MKLSISNFLSIMTLIVGTSVAQTDTSNPCSPLSTSLQTCLSGVGASDAVASACDTCLEAIISVEGLVTADSLCSASDLAACTAALACGSCVGCIDEAVAYLECDIDYDRSADNSTCSALDCSSFSLPPVGVGAEAPTMAPAMAPTSGAHTLLGNVLALGVTSAAYLTATVVFA